ncbi:hypothetical protein QUA27_04930 [Microcoleus sp. Pol14C6]|uniref:hypothetical protein n=1 Tax=unclassified Microcoleus TaxID=2642155 RepID=UPI002FD51766
MPTSLAQTSLDAIQVLDRIKAVVSKAEGKKRILASEASGWKEKSDFFSGLDIKKQSLFPALGIDPDG